MLKSLQDTLNRVHASFTGYGKDSDARVLVKYTAAILGTYTALQVASFAWKYYLRPAPSLRAKNQGTWAIVTGGTGGIGLGIAQELAAQGINIVLVARDKQRLSTTASSLRDSNPEIQTREVSMNAENTSDFSVLSKEIADLDVSFLVNNVGVHNHVPTTVEDMEAREVQRIVHVNCTFQVQLTAAVVPHMRRLAQRRAASVGSRPLVVNVSSLTSKMAMPLLSVYAATKAFEEHWTLGLGAELDAAGIDVICLRPVLTVSAMSGETTPSLFCPSAETMAKACVRMFRCGEISVAPYGPHAFLDVVNFLTPAKLSWGIVRDMHEKKRQALLSK
jgi:17beta-estradiol 17-dehydrogenase / very-long-chain 3-oxoacyl-CoA reductase